MLKAETFREVNLKAIFLIGGITSNPGFTINSRILVFD